MVCTDTAVATVDNRR